VGLWLTYLICGVCAYMKIEKSASVDAVPVLGGISFHRREGWHVASIYTAVQRVINCPLHASAGGCLASWMYAPLKDAASLGASGAVFGLFAVAVLTKIKPSLKKLLEAGILGAFVFNQVFAEVGYVTNGGRMTASGMAVGHWAHLAGAMAGVALVLVLSRLPGGDM
jgi:membrane associated rhomboid family serine protease